MRLLNVMVRLKVISRFRTLNMAPVKSSLPVVRHAVHNERVAEDNRIDRMAIWMRNVERKFITWPTHQLYNLNLQRSLRTLAKTLPRLLEKSHLFPRFR